MGDPVGQHLALSMPCECRPSNAGHGSRSGTPFPPARSHTCTRACAPSHAPAALRSAHVSFRRGCHACTAPGPLHQALPAESQSGSASKCATPSPPSYLMHPSSSRLKESASTETPCQSQVARVYTAVCHTAVCHSSLSHSLMRRLPKHRPRQLPPRHSLPQHSPQQRRPPIHQAPAAGGVVGIQAQPQPCPSP